MRKANLNLMLLGIFLIISAFFFYDTIGWYSMEEVILWFGAGILFAVIVLTGKEKPKVKLIYKISKEDFMKGGRNGRRN